MFVSASSHVLLQLGQPLDEGATAFIQPAADPIATTSQTSQEGQKRKLNVSVRPSNSNISGDRSSPAGSKSGGGGSKSGPSLLDLLEAGMLQPGADNMRVTYKGNTYSGALQSNGTILFNGTTFNTPSAFSVHVKRIITPGKQGDDGWHSVYVDGVLLNAVRQQYQAKVLGQPYKQQPNKAPRRSQSSPRGQQQQQQPSPQHNQQQALPMMQPQQQQSSPQQQQQQRPPLPTPKLKLGNIKGLPQQQQQQEQMAGDRALQPAAPPEQTAQQQPKANNPQKLKFKMSLKIGKGAAQAAAAVSGPGQQPQQPQQQVEPAAGGPCAFNPNLHVVAPAHPQQTVAADVGPPDWVRCCRCEQWRRVPDDSHPQVAAVGAHWYCEDASWDLKQQQPYTAACMPDVWADTPDEGLMVPA